MPIPQEVPKEVRFALYKKAIPVLQECRDSLASAGFCRGLKQSMSDKEFDMYGNPYRDLEIMFPELVAYKPEQWFSPNHWFCSFGEGIEKRIEILQEIINKQ